MIYISALTLPVKSNKRYSDLLLLEARKICTDGGNVGDSISMNRLGLLLEADSPLPKFEDPPMALTPMLHSESEEEQL